MRLGSVPELGDERMPFERLLDDATLDAAAASVDQADLAKPCFPRGGDVLVDARLDVLRLKGVQVERGFDRNSMGLVRSHSSNPPRFHTNIFERRSFGGFGIRGVQSQPAT